MKNVCVLTEEGRDYDTEALRRMEQDIAETFGETDELNFLLGPDLNDTEFLIDTLKDPRTGYLFTSLKNMGYFHPASEFPTLIRLFEKHAGENTWSVLAPLIEKGFKENPPQ